MQSIAVLDLKTNQITEYPDKRFGEDVAPELFPGSGLQLRRQASLRFGRFDHRPHRSEAGRHRQRHRRLQLRRWQGRARAIHRHRTASALRREKSCHRSAENPAGHRDSLSRRISIGFLRRRRQQERSTSGSQQSFRQRGAARYRERQSAPAFRPKHERSCAVFVSLWMRRHARRPPRLVQLMERITSRRIGSGQRQSSPLDQVAGTKRSYCPRLASHGTAAKSRRENSLCRLIKCRCSRRSFNRKRRTILSRSTPRFAPSSTRAHTRTLWRNLAMASGYLSPTPPPMRSPFLIRPTFNQSPIPTPSPTHRNCCRPSISRGCAAGAVLRLMPLGFIPTDWYPSALAVQGDDLLIATAKGQGTRPNKGPGKTAWEVRHHEHPYIPTLLRGSIARLNIPSTLGKLDELTRVVEHDNLLDRDQTTPAPSSSPAARIPSSTSSTSSKKTAPTTRFSAI